MSQIQIGCCAAYCGTCPALADGTCLGCRLGYDAGERDISKARCKMKVRCLTKLGTACTCADCPDCLTCGTLQGFYGKKGYRYGKYRQSFQFIRSHGYDRFLQAADQWTSPRGRLP